MTGVGFFHPDRGYWQTLGKPSAALNRAYPKGTVEVPLQPDADHEWDGAAWVRSLPPPQASLDARDTLTPAQFAYLLAITDWGKLWDRVAKAAKVSSAEFHARISAQRAAGIYTLGGTLAFIAHPAVQQILGGDAPDEVEVRRRWNEAKTVNLTAQGEAK